MYVVDWKNDDVDRIKVANTINEAKSFMKEALEHEAATTEYEEVATYIHEHMEKYLKAQYYSSDDMDVCCNDKEYVTIYIKGLKSNTWLHL